MKKVLSIVLCAMVLVAMLSSSAFAVVKTVVLENNETAKNSAEVFGSWKIVRACPMVGSLPWSVRPPGSWRH